MRHVTQYGSRFAIFGKHSMLLYIHGTCMHVCEFACMFGFSDSVSPIRSRITPWPAAALWARQYGSRCKPAQEAGDAPVMRLPPLTLFALEDNQSSASARTHRLALHLSPASSRQRRNSTRCSTCLRKMG